MTRSVSFSSNPPAYETSPEPSADAAFAMGNRASEWVEELEGLEALAVTATGDTWRTTAFLSTSAALSA